MADDKQTDQKDKTKTEEPAITNLVEPTPEQLVDELDPRYVLVLEGIAETMASLDQRVSEWFDALAAGKVPVADDGGDILERIRELLASATPANTVRVEPSDIAEGQMVKVSHLDPPDSPYSGHQGRVIFVPPNGDWPFVVAFHPGGTSVEPGGRFPTTFARNEIEAVRG